MAPKAVIYARRSKDESGSTSVADQIARCEAMCTARGWEYEIVSEVASASSFARKPRPKWAGVLQMIEDRSVNYLVCWAQDRLIRKPVDLIRLVELCRRNGVSVAFASTNSVDDFSSGGARLMALIQSGLAAEEVEATSTRIRLNTASRAARGGIHGKNLWGYGRLRDGVTGRVAKVIPDDNARWVREIYRLYVEESMTSYGISRWLNEQEVPTRRSHLVKPGAKDGRLAIRWTGAAVSEILRNPAYAGIRRHRSINPQTFEETVAEYPADWEGLVSEETWRRAQERLNGNPAMPPTRARTLLGGLLACGVCGGPLYVGANNRGRRRKDGTRPRYASLVCIGRSAAAQMGHVTISAELAEEYIVDVLLTRLSELDLNAAPGDTVADEQAAAIAAQIAAKQTYLERIAEAGFASGDPEMVIDARRRTLPVIEDLRRQLGQLQRIDQAAVWLAGHDDLREAWEGLPLATQRAILSGMVLPVVARSERPGARGAAAVAARITMLWKTGDR